MQNAPHTLCGAFFYGVGAAERGTGMSGGACRPHRAGWGDALWGLFDVCVCWSESAWLVM